MSRAGAQGDSHDRPPAGYRNDHGASNDADALGVTEPLDGGDETPATRVASLGYLSPRCTRDGGGVIEATRNRIEPATGPTT